MASHNVSPDDAIMGEAIDSYKELDLAAALTKESCGKSIETKLNETKDEFIEKYKGDGHDEIFLSHLEKELTQENRKYYEAVTEMDLHQDVGVALPALSSGALRASIEERKVELKKQWVDAIFAKELHASWFNDLFDERLNKWEQGVKGIFT